MIYSAFFEIWLLSLSSSICDIDLKLSEDIEMFTYPHMEKHLKTRINDTWTPTAKNNIFRKLCNVYYLCFFVVDIVVNFDFVAFVHMLHILESVGRAEPFKFRSGGDVDRRWRKR